MSKKLIQSILITAGCAFLFTGCVVRERATYHADSGAVTTDVEVTGPPPPEVVETVTVAPGPGFLWIGGYYGWEGGGWHWHPGHWEQRPRPGAVWVHPHYVYRGGRHVWVRGGWR
jgi:hypothetical protein